MADWDHLVRGDHHPRCPADPGADQDRYQRALGLYPVYRADLCLGATAPRPTAALVDPISQPVSLAGLLAQKGR